MSTQGAAFVHVSSRQVPVVDEFVNVVSTGVDEPQARPSNSSRTAAAVMDRPRPKVQRPSSFFGAVDDAIDDGDRHQQRTATYGDAATHEATPTWPSNSAIDAPTTTTPRSALTHHQQQQQQARDRASTSTYNRSQRSSQYDDGSSEQFADATQRPPSSEHPQHHRSSFFGAQQPYNDRTSISTTSTSMQHTREPSPNAGDSSRAHTPSSNHHSSSRNIHHSAGESSGSFSSSYDAPHRTLSAAKFYSSANHAAAAVAPSPIGAPPHPHPSLAAAAVTPHINTTNLSSSRAPSVYGTPSSAVDPASTSTTAIAAPLLDQSHLQPGGLATLLSHEKTLELYRANAKKTNDPDIQFDFCTFVMEVVGEMEAAEEREFGLTRRRRPSTEIETQAKLKQQALVAESVAILNKLANRGHVKSQYFLADCYTQGIGTPKGKRDYDKAFQLFVLAGKHGHSDACFRAAQCFENGWGCKRDNSRSVQLLKRAAVLNHPAAMHRLGIAEINGELGLSKRPREGVRWLKRAAELADQVEPPQPQSLHELALLHEKGIENVIFQDEDYAAELLARASELQYAPSAYKLGECYEYGKMGCPQDAALSIHYYNIAAQQNHREACFALTAWYLVGSPGVLPQSDTEAYLWARRAAEMELAKAEYAVGYFTEMGIGTHQDTREALDWFRKAASHGDKRAQEKLRMSGLPSRNQQQQQDRNPKSNASPPVPSKQVYKPPTMTTQKAIKKDKKSTSSLRAERPPRGSSVDSRMQQLPPLPTGAKTGANGGRPSPPFAPVRQRSNSFSGSDSYTNNEFGTHPMTSSQFHRSQQQQVVGQGYLNGQLQQSQYSSHSLPGPQNGYGRAVPIEHRLGDGATRYGNNNLNGGMTRTGVSYASLNGQHEQSQQPPPQHRLPPGAGVAYVNGVGIGEQEQQASSSPAQYHFVDEAQRRRDVLQKRKVAAGAGSSTGPGEDKDCIIM
ncbi:Chitin synthase 4 [Microbotryomycetes sp. JL221]|nr:Chitin synthase 4 [Microbotryomycetes sp. JL221]